MAYETIPIFAPIFEKIDSSLVNVLSDKSSALIGLISPVVAVCFSVYFLLIILSYMRDNSSWSGSVVDMIKRIAAWALIISASVNISFYIGTVVPIVNGLPVEISNVLTSSDASNNINSVDSIISYYITVIQEMIAKAEGVKAYIIVGFNILLLLVFGIPVVIVMAAYLLLAKLMLAILMAIGPLFLCLALFPVTKQYAALWVGQVVNFMLLAIFMNITVVVMIEILLSMKVTPSSASLIDILSYGVVAILFCIIVLRIPDLASSLSSGISANGFGSAIHSGNQALKMASALSKGLKSGGGGGNSNSISKESSGR